MTCIVGVVGEKSVLLGADSAVSTQYHVEMIRDPKVFKIIAKHPGEIIQEFGIAGCGSVRNLRLLRYKLKPPLYDPNSGSVDHYMNTLFVDEVRKTLLDSGCITKVNLEEKTVDSQFIVAFMGDIYFIKNDFGVYAPIENEVAGGAGMEYALGSLYSTRGSNLGNEERVELALKAASYYNPWCRGPYTVVEFDK